MLFPFGISVFLLIVLIFLSGFFSSVETALVSLDRIALKRLVKGRVKNSKAVQKLKENPHRMLSTILIGNNLVNIFASILAADIVVSLTESMGLAEATGIGIATAVMTFLLLAFGEITPKGIATRKNEQISLLAARPIILLSKIFSPVIWVLDRITHVLINAIGGPPKEDTMTMEEFNTMVTVGREEGTIDAIEHEIITKATKMDEIPVREVMTPLHRVLGISQEAKLPKLLKLIEGRPFSRIPVFHESPENIIGILYLKDIIPYLADKSISKIAVKDVMMPAMFVPATTKSDFLLKELQHRKIHVAIVTDKARVIGLVSLEDLLEELVGEIFDESERPPSIKKIDKRTIMASGTAALNRVNKLLGTRLKSEEFRTIGGYIFGEIDRFPKKGESLKLDELRIKIEEAIGCKIVRMKISKK